MLQELKEEDPLSYRNLLRINADRFQELLEMTRRHIQKKNTQMRSALPAQLKLEITLRYLATDFRMTRIPLSRFIPSNTFLELFDYFFY